MISLVRRAGAIALGAALVLGLGATSSVQRASASPPSCPVVWYHTAPEIRAQRVCMNLGVTTHGSQPGTYLFLTPGGLPHPGAGIYQDNGTLVWWYHPRKDFNLSVVHYRGQRYLATWVSAGRTPAAVYLYNEHYQQVGTVTTGGAFRSSGIDLHEFRITPQGDALFGVYDVVPGVYKGHRYEVGQYVIQKVSLVDDSTGIHTGRVLFQWESLQHVPLSQSHMPPPTGDSAWDYFHGNSIAQDSDGNLIVSARNTWGIYKINIKTGQIMWQVGTRGDHTLGKPWCYQHDVTPLGNDRYSLFDDGGSDPGCLPGSSDHPSRALIVQVDPSQTPAGVTLVHAYKHKPPLLASLAGSTQVLGNGDVLIDWGGVPEVTQYTADGAVRMDLSLSDWSYRAYRFPWVGLPLTRPAVAAQRTALGTDVWASWNGSTQVTAWRVLAGSDSSHLSAVGAPTPKKSFETEITLPRAYGAVAVQAIGASDRALATSRPITARSGS
jgi:hypothetical protein